MNDPTIKTVTTCPTCGSQCKVIGSDEGTHFYEPIKIAQLHSQEERDKSAQEKDVNCFCGNKATGAWGLQVGRHNPFKFTPKMPYCARCISDMIDGLTLVVKDLKKIRNMYRSMEGKPPIK